MPPRECSVKAANVSDPHERIVLTLPVRHVFAVQVREHDDMFLVRLVGFDDADPLSFDDAESGPTDSESPA